MRDCGDDFELLGYSAYFWVGEEGNRYDCISFEEDSDGINDGETIKASGSANFPKHFGEFRSAIGEMLKPVEE